MKTPILFFVAAFLLLSVSAFSQDQKTVFENASVTKSANGSSYVALNWKKGNENTAYYLLERSVDGKAFKPIALVFTGEDNNFVDYKFNDKTIGSANNAFYYRISIVSDKKDVSYLPVKKVSLAADVNSIYARDFSNALAKN